MKIIRLLLSFVFRNKVHHAYSGFSDAKIEIVIFALIVLVQSSRTLFRASCFFCLFEHRCLKLYIAVTSFDDNDPGYLLTGKQFSINVTTCNKGMEGI